MILMLSEGAFVGILVPDKTTAGKECLLLMLESLAHWHFTLMNSWYKRLHHCLRSYDNWFSISVDVSVKTCFCQTHVCTMSSQEGVDVPSLRILHTNQASITNLWTWGSYLLETYWHGQLFCRTFHVFCKIYADLSITLFTTRKTLQSSRKDFSCQIRPTFCCRAAAVLYLNSIAHIWYFLAEYHKTVVEKRMDHLPSRPICKRYVTYFLTRYRVFSLTWPASMQIYWNKRKRLHEKRVQLPQDFLGTPTWPPFHCFGTPKWPPWRHVKTLCTDSAFTLGARDFSSAV